MDKEAVAFKAMRDGQSAHFGVESTARAWAGKSGTVDTVLLRTLSIVPTEPAPSAALDARDAARLHWLHNNTYVDKDGWEYGVARLKFHNGQLIAAEWTLSDHSDIDAAMRHSPAPEGKL